VHQSVGLPPVRRPIARSRRSAWSWPRSTAGRPTARPRWSSRARVWPTEAHV